MNWSAWLVLLSPFMVLLIMWIWLKFTEWQIDKQYRQRQDDE
jgi:type II secretory pathway component PulL